MLCKYLRHLLKLFYHFTNHLLAISINCLNTYSVGLRPAPFTNMLMVLDCSNRFKILFALAFGILELLTKSVEENIGISNKISSAFIAYCECVMPTIFSFIISYNCSIAFAFSMFFSDCSITPLKKNKIHPSQSLLSVTAFKLS